ncbi:MAG: hypothetical protein HOJ79_15615 [Nitrospina sp.]|jgi:hypothetical protein|nr:hypothetical protein [Nitrospina sp.]
MKKLFKALKPFSFWKLILACFYPLTTIFTTPIQLARSLWSCRILVFEPWKNYPHFHPHMAITSLWYWTQAQVIFRFGRSGKCPYLGLGDFPISTWFYITKPSSYAYWKAGAITMLVGMFGWWLSHLFWLNVANDYWVFLIMGLVFISTFFYANTFRLENYNILGWLFFSAGLYGLINQEWIIATISWALMSLGSFTAVFVAGILSLSVAIFTLSFMPLVVILPAAIMSLLPLLENYREGRSILQSGLAVLDASGTAFVKSKYKRQITWNFRLFQLYFLLICFPFGIACIWLDLELKYLYWTGLSLWISNITFAHFADEERLLMMMVSISTAIIMQNENLSLLLPYWLLISPLPLILFLPMKVLGTVPLCQPFSVKLLIEDMKNFLNPVEKGQRVLMAFKDPQGGDYHQALDGLEIHLSLPMYTAVEKEVLFLPNLPVFFETSYKNQIGLWGKEPEEVLQNVSTWMVDYVVVYQDKNTPLENKWIESGFYPLKEFRWSDYAPQMELANLPQPTWWLLKPPSQGKTRE